MYYATLNVVKYDGFLRVRTTIIRVYVFRFSKRGKKKKLNTTSRGSLCGNDARGQERLRKRNNYTSVDDLKIMDLRFACVEFFFIYILYTLRASSQHTYTHVRYIDTRRCVALRVYLRVSI